MVPVIAFIGRHNAGKTTVLIQVLHLLQQTGMRIGVIKHSHHSPTPDNYDSGKLFAAGAQRVFFSTPHANIIYSREEEQSVERIIGEMGTVDLVLLEGYKESPYPKIEIIRNEIDPDPLGVVNVIARVTDREGFNDGLPQFEFGKEAELVKFIIEQSFESADKKAGGGPDA